MYTGRAVGRAVGRAARERKVQLRNLGRIVAIVLTLTRGLSELLPLLRGDRKVFREAADTGGRDWEGTWREQDAGEWQAPPSREEQKRLLGELTRQNRLLARALEKLYMRLRVVSFLAVMGFLIATGGCLWMIFHQDAPHAPPGARGAAPVAPAAPATPAAPASGESA